MSNGRNERLSRQRGTYTLEIEGRLCIVENVTARVDEDTGEQFFTPHTVQRLQETILGQAEPSKLMEVSVCEYPG